MNEIFHYLYWRIYQTYNWEKYIFYWEKLNFEHIGNSVHTASIGKALKAFFISTTICFTQADNIWNKALQIYIQQWF